MKRFLRTSTFLLGLVMVSLVLVRCVRETADLPQAAVEAADFSLFLLPEDTRTTNDGLSTNWTAGDRFSLYHRVTGTDGFVLDNPFTVDDPATGHATGTVRPLQGDVLDWSAVYPYADVDAPHAVPVTVGCPSDGNQVQSAYGSMAHLAGDCFPLYGSVSGISVDAVPTIPMQQLAAVAAVKVTNGLDEPVFIDGLTLEADTPLVGSFTLNLLDGDGTLTPETGLVTGKAILVLTTAEALAPGETALFYLGIRPVTLDAGSSLTLSVDARNGEGLPATQIKTVTLPQAVSFRAGHIRSLAFGFTGPFEEPEEGTYVFSRVTEVTPGRRYLLVFQAGDGAVMALSRKDSELQFSIAPVTFDGSSIRLTSLDDAFTISEAVKADGTLVEGGYTLRQENGQFVGVNSTQSSRNLAFTSGAASNQYWWKCTVTDGTVALVARNKTLQLFTDTDVDQVGASTAADGILPQLYRLVNEEETAEALLNETEYGAYGLPDWIYEAGTMQLSLLASQGGTVSFRIFEPHAKSVTQMAGIPTELAVDDNFTIDVLRYERGKVKLDKPFVVRVLKLEGSKAWLVSPTGAGFIVKYQ